MKKMISGLVRGYMLVMNGGVVEERDLGRFLKKMKSLGYTYVGDNDNHRHREELQGAPKFRELAGPMWGGQGRVRYETSEVYRQMSAGIRKMVASEMLKIAKSIVAAPQIRPSFKGKRLEGAITGSMAKDMERGYGKLRMLLEKSPAENQKWVQRVKKNLEDALQQTLRNTDFSYLSALHTAYINLSDESPEAAQYAKREYDSWLRVIQDDGRSDFIYLMEHKLSLMLNKRMPRTVNWRRLKFDMNRGDANYLLLDINGDEQMLVEVTGIGSLPKGGMEISVENSVIGYNNRIWNVRNLGDAEKIFKEISNSVTGIRASKVASELVVIAKSLVSKDWDIYDEVKEVIKGFNWKLIYFKSKYKYGEKVDAEFIELAERVVTNSFIGKAWMLPGLESLAYVSEQQKRNKFPKSLLKKYVNRMMKDVVMPEIDRAREASNGCSSGRVSC